jgi:26S proteasome regulatory subunit T6
MLPYSFLCALITPTIVVDFDSEIELSALTPNIRVALRSDSYTIHKILPNKVDPLVSLMMVEKVPDSTYEMVGGLDKQIKEIKEVIELPVKHPELFESLGIAQPKGVLLYGPPGTGKTLLARAVAHHTDCKFIRVSGSELVQKYIGEGSRMVRELFVMAREHAPSIIFMDEIDSIGSSRGESGSGGGDSEVQRTMMELLNQLDGFESAKNIKVIMATNRIGKSSCRCLMCRIPSPFVTQIFWTLHFFGLVVSIERSSSLRRVLRLVLAS